ncbi:MAG: NTP transferase domain-containing protein [Dorea sp.]|jgi:CTP:phosphocholine cytidylyltransferase-like protein|nr:NTP transferase domain-containing protein [Dorea sp.]
MNRVKRAIIMAAGVGKRMQPLTLTTPKPLVRVNGARMIDTVLRGLHQNGITEIYVVVGHLKEQFQSLEMEYPGLKLIENPYYDTCNNISSLYAARAYMEDAMILDGDQIIYNADILAPEFERSGYNAVWTDGETKEWLLTVKDGVVQSCSRDGGREGWQLYSISRWSSDDARKLKRHLEIEFEEKKNRQIYWDDVALFCYPGSYELGIRKMESEDIIEIDSLEELLARDDSYKGYGSLGWEEIQDGE